MKTQAKSIINLCNKSKKCLVLRHSKKSIEDLLEDITKTLSMNMVTKSPEEANLVSLGQHSLRLMELKRTTQDPILSKIRWEAPLLKIIVTSTIQ